MLTSHERFRSKEVTTKVDAENHAFFWRTKTKLVAAVSSQQWPIAFGYAATSKELNPLAFDLLYQQVKPRPSTMVATYSAIRNQIGMVL